MLGPSKASGAGSSRAGDGTARGDREEPGDLVARAAGPPRRAWEHSEGTGFCVWTEAGGGHESFHLDSKENGD